MRPYFLFRIRNPCFLIFFERVSDTLNLLECEPCILICLNIECMCHRKKEKIILGSLYRHSPLCQIEEQERLCESILFLYDCVFIDMLPEDHFCHSRIISMLPSSSSIHSRVSEVYEKFISSSAVYVFDCADMEEK